jgi:hypothetical protein
VFISSFGNYPVFNGLVRSLSYWSSYGAEGAMLTEAQPGGCQLASAATAGRSYRFEPVTSTKIFFFSPLIPIVSFGFQQFGASAFLLSLS